MKQHRVPIVAVLAAVVVMAIWYAAVWMPEGSKLKAARVSESQALSQIATEQSQLLMMRSDAPKVVQEEKVLESLVKALPDGPSVDQLLRTINVAATQSKVTIATLSVPQPAGWAGSNAAAAPATATGPDSLTLSVAITGSNANILRFVTDVDAQPRIYVVNTLTLQPSDSGSLSASLSVETFFESSTANDPTFPG
jgi:Tfp pilus assembly protein PilO